MENRDESGGTVVIYRGVLCVTSNGEEDVLGLRKNDIERPDILADTLQDDIAAHGNYLSVSYYLAPEEMPVEQMQEEWLKKVFGAGDVEYDMVYSDYTGYLWTDEKINVGGHDLLEELESAKGKFLHMEITYHKSDPAARVPSDTEKS